MITLIPNYRKRKDAEAMAAEVASLRVETDEGAAALAELSEIVSEDNDAIAELSEIVASIVGGEQ